MTAPVGVIAGGGDLPRQLVERITAEGGRAFVLAIAGSADPQIVKDYPGAEISIGEIGKQLDALKAAGCTEVTFVGIVRRPDFSTLRLDMKGALLLPRVVAAARKGDDALLRTVLQVYEEAGFKVRGAETYSPALLATPGPLGAFAPDEHHRHDMRVAARAAGAIGQLDIGQGAVSCDGVVLALEAQEGTDQMLRRCAALPEHLRGVPGARRGVLVKRPKPIQERRIDLPTIGLETVRLAASAGLAGVAVEAGAALVLDEKGVVRLADELGLFVYGFTAEEVS